MRRRFVIVPLAIAALASVAALAAETPGPSPALRAAIAAASRTPANVQRDAYRHPAETLAFFGVKPTDNVVEIWPAGGWYTEILAPYLAKGSYTAAAPSERARGRAETDGRQWRGLWQDQVRDLSQRRRARPGGTGQRRRGADLPQRP